MRAVLALALIACLGRPSSAHPDVVEPTSTGPLPAHRTYELDTTPKQRRRMVPPEVFVRAYLRWFGGLAPLDVEHRAQPKQLFDQWKDYLAALGLPDYRIDLPRSPQSNTIMVATIGRLAEALCIRAVEHDLVAAPPIAQRLIFAFEDKPNLSQAEFATRFDVLHRTFLSYPVALAPADRVAKFYALFQQIAASHAGSGELSPERTAWAAICTALVQHPETELY